LSRELVHFVGLTRQSIGRPSGVIERRAAPGLASRHHAVAASAATQGWQTAIMCAPGTDTPVPSDVPETLIMWSMLFVTKAEAAAVSGTSARVPVVDVDVVLGKRVFTVIAQEVAEGGPTRARQHVRGAAWLRHLLGKRIKQSVPNAVTSTASSVPGTSSFPTIRSRCRNGAGYGSARRGRSAHRRPR